MGAAILAFLGGWRAVGFLLLALGAMVTVGVQTYRLRGVERDFSDYKAQAALDLAAAEKKARTIETSSVEVIFNAAAAYDRGVYDASELAKKVVADLAAGTTRLRSEWAGCEADLVSQDAAARQRFAENEQRRRESAAEIVRIAAECDAQNAALISAYDGVRAKINGQ